MQEESTGGRSPFLHLFLQVLFILFAGLFLFFTLGFSAILVDHARHSGQIMPGIAMLGVDLSGMQLGEAAQTLATHISLSNDSTITLSYGDIYLPILPEQIGLHLDLAASARKAFEYGHRGSLGSILAYQLFCRYDSCDIQPIVTFDEQVAFDYLRQAASQYDRPLQEAGLTLEGTRVVAVPGQVGRHLDVLASIDRIAEHVKRADFSPIPLVVHEQYPQILDASPFASQAQQTLSRPFELIVPQGQPDAGKVFPIPPAEMAPMLVFNRYQTDGGTTIQPQFRQDLLLAYLKDLAGRVDIQPQNPRFIFNDDTRQLDLLAHAIIGREMDVEKTLAAVQSALASGASSAPLAFNTLLPKVSDDVSANDLGITELIHQEHSYFFGSREPRIQNIEKAASEFHGLLVPPGATFSMAAAMGNITLDNGYKEDLIIYNGRTIEGVGGGVCQVSTTLFRAAFFAGFPIVERHPHAYRVSYYEKTANNSRDPNLAGLDATVFIPLVDLKFINDTPYWLLMETYVNRAANRLTWKFYSTSDGRQVEWQTSGPINIVEPKKPLYKLNEDLEPGEIKQVDWEADGADVRVDRYIYRDGMLINSDTFFTHYAPWRAVYEYGPGTEGIPEDGDE